MTSLLAHCSPSISNRIPAQGRQIKQPRQKHEVYICISIWPASSLLCIHGPASAALPAALQHLLALFAFAATQPGLEDGDLRQCLFTYLFTLRHFSFSNIIFIFLSFHLPLSLSRFLILVVQHFKHLSPLFFPSSSSVCARRWDISVGCPAVCFTACRYISIILQRLEI